MPEDPVEQVPEPPKEKPPEPPKKKWRQKLADLGNGIGEAIGEALFGGGR